MKQIVDYAFMLLKDYVNENSVVVDFTMGNGHDTIKLALLTPRGKVFAFDIQEQALINTRAKLNKYNLNNVQLILDSHHHVDKYITNFKVGIFNFGYLPHSDHAITTELITSKVALQKALSLLEVKGIIILVIYPGHEQGKQESEYFDQLVKNLDSYYYDVFKFLVPNKNNCPYIIGIEKKRENNT